MFPNHNKNFYEKKLKMEAQRENITKKKIGKREHTATS